MQTRHYSVAILLAVIAITSAFYLNTLIAPAAATDPKLVANDISVTRFMNNVAFLASDEMKGRGDGSPELEKAADYIAAQFRLWGLRPMGDNSTYFQHFEITTGAQTGPKSELQVNGTNLTINEDFVPIPFSNTAEFGGPLIFAGYGISAP